MQIKIKKVHPKAVIPTYSKDGDAGMDLTCVSKEFTINSNLSTDDLPFYDNIVYKLGIAVEIPKGYVGLIFPRSSISKTSLILQNSVGVIDSGYRGELLCKFNWANLEPDQNHEDIIEYEVGDRVAQLIVLPYPEVFFEVVEELAETDRGEGGFGSTGK